MKILEINHMRKHFGELEVLNDISLSVEAFIMNRLENRLNYYR